MLFSLQKHRLVMAVASISLSLLGKVGVELKELKEAICKYHFYSLSRGKSIEKIERSH
jgi:hypothetical protein